MPRVFWWVLAAMMLSWASMNLWSAPRIEEMSGGLKLLDMRLTGYAFAEARAFLAAIGDEGRAFYLRVQLPLDMVFPPLLGAVLFLVFRWLFPGRIGLVIGIASLSSVVVDYLENAALAGMLRAGADGLTPEMVAAANQWTTTKWALAALGGAALVVGLALRLYRRLTAG